MSEVSKQMEKLEQEINEKKAQLKALEEKYTFKGVYKAVAGRHNILRELKDNTDLTDIEKFDSAKELLQQYLKSL